MSKLSKEEVENIARLARLKLTDEERDFYAEELSAVLGYVEQLNEVDVSGVETTAHASGIDTIVRTDEPRSASDNPDMVKRLMQAVPFVEKGFIKVKAVLNRS
ncbi:MAG: hypothetical protein A2932_00220 [Candidatus Spechtbacteria bacterium RIFCSPLOWO2_01_FULL_46_10]|uniref:Aspartyl/glutamyl-tRNA(Asn/Gln) amidotransferase subunit C n=1 Tax=Candidatus Spechtbacteria bacterium RIFCSPLOWO2_01_FULL_46_10 TaxID=1802163 RepID=A0A1G2HFG5_9BACT|nr:MAG: hypothetical protein A2932_00220 [Candidatus Spechtbacteria bacterium RIFCSPLOWO2_01_FULL_46_10]